MRSHTLTLTLPASREELFAWLSDLENLPFWATNFCQRIWNTTTGWKMFSVAGEVFVSLQSDRATGVVDLFWGKYADEMTLIPLRVLDLPHGSALTATYFRTATMPGEIHELVERGLSADLRHLQKRFGTGKLEKTASRPVFPGLVTGKFYETWDFYTAVLDFKTIQESDDYVQLAHASGTQLAILRHEFDGMPSELISSADGRGFWLSIEVPDADAEFQRLIALGAAMDEPPQDRSWGHRQFFLRDPNGILISIAHPLPIMIGAQEDELARV